MNTDYSTNLTDKQWQVIEKIINPQVRKRKHSLRNIMNAILYLLKTGCQWRMIPKDFAPWESVYYYFSKWRLFRRWIVIDKIDSVSSVNFRCPIQVFESDIRIVGWIGKTWMCYRIRVFFTKWINETSFGQEYRQSQRTTVSWCFHKFLVFSCQYRWECTLKSPPMMIGMLSFCAR